MSTAKKLEIVIDALEVHDVVAVLDQCGVNGYTILRNATGKGGRGLRSDDELTGVFKNSYIITACEEGIARQVAEGIRPLLKRFGGICMITDVELVDH